MELFDKEVLKRAVYPKWYLLWLWFLPTQKNVLEGFTIIFKRFNGRIYITDLIESK